MRNDFTKRRARELRSKLTDAERRLWYFLRRNQFGCHFKRQFAIGPYFVDFVCVRMRLVIEIDGGQHAEQQSYDTARDDFLGLKVSTFCMSGTMRSCSRPMRYLR